MFNNSAIQSKLDEEILAALNELESLETTSDDYGTTIDRIAKLQKLKSEGQIQLPSMDTVLVVGANIFGILWLTRYEREHVISSKALGFVLRPH